MKTAFLMLGAYISLMFWIVQGSYKASGSFFHCRYQLIILIHHYQLQSAFSCEIRVAVARYDEIVYVLLSGKGWKISTAKSQNPT